MTTRTLPWLGLAILLGLTWLAYQPGLTGGFLFDDFVNLNALGATGPIDNWPAFWRYMSSGTADPIGRPLALLSFLVDARDWPADPAIFLRTNLLLHLCNGVLLFALLRLLEGALQEADKRNDATALLAAGLWLLHPLLVSTTLYAVQREAMLPATFTLAGLLAYGYGRLRFQNTDGRSGACRMVAGLGLGTALALLSKGNGILLPLLAWVLESAVFSHCGTRSLAPTARLKLRRLKWIWLILPSSLLTAYLAWHLPLLGQDLGNRPWTLGQRLLTEPRVVLDYLHLLVVPRSVSTGLYNDSYVVSKSLLQPISTLPAILAVCGLVLGAFQIRTRLPRLSAALLFFFAGHLLESTLIPLELYFEHRNYLPALLFFWPISYAVFHRGHRKYVQIAFASLLLGIFFYTTFTRASLWGQPDVLARLWAHQNPESSRAQATAGMILINTGQFVQAAQHLGPLWTKRPADVQIAFNYINAVCQWRGVTEDEKRRVAVTLRRSPTGQLLIHQWLGRSIDVAASGTCPGLKLADVAMWISAAASNPGISPTASRDQTIEPLLGQLAIRQGQPKLALGHFNRALAAFTTPDVAARNASQLASAGYYSEALSHLNYYETIRDRIAKPPMGMPRLHAEILERQNYWPWEMKILREKITVELTRSGK